MSSSLLIVEDDEVMRLTLQGYFTQKGYAVHGVAKGKVGLEVVKKNEVDVALLDINLPDGSGLDFLPRMRAENEDLVVVVMTAYPDVANAVQAMKDGAFDYIIKPFDLDDMDLTLERALEHRALRSRVEQLEAEQSPRPALHALLGASAPMAELRDILGMIARSPRSTVLVLGESGTGKELVVNAIHAESDRREGPLIRINCSAIPESLIESEIFGYEKGAFTGALGSKRGLLELAHRGTLFFDELGDLSAAFQPKLLRVMEERAFRRRRRSAGPRRGRALCGRHQPQPGGDGARRNFQGGPLLPLQGDGNARPAVEGPPWRCAGALGTLYHQTESRAGQGDYRRG